MRNGDGRALVPVVLHPCNMASLTLERSIKDPDIKYNDSVKKAKERHDVVLRKEKEIDEFVKSETLRDVPCDHKNYSYKGHLICAVCGLTKRDFDPFALTRGTKTEFT